MVEFKRAGHIFVTRQIGRHVENVRRLVHRAIL